MAQLDGYVGCGKRYRLYCLWRKPILDLLKSEARLRWVEIIYSQAVGAWTKQSSIVGGLTQKIPLVKLQKKILTSFFQRYTFFYNIWFKKLWKKNIRTIQSCAQSSAESHARSLALKVPFNVSTFISFIQNCVAYTVASFFLKIFDVKHFFFQMIIVFLFSAMQLLLSEIEVLLVFCEMWNFCVVGIMKWPLLSPVCIALFQNQQELTEIF